VRAREVDELDLFRSALQLLGVDAFLGRHERERPRQEHEREQQLLHHRVLPVSLSYLV